MKTKTTPKKNLKKKSNIYLRSASGVGIVALTFGILYLGALPFLAFIALLAGLSLYEWGGMIAPQTSRVLRGFVALLATSVVISVGYVSDIAYFGYVLVLTAIFVRMFLGFRGVTDDQILKRYAAGFFYMAGSLSAFALLIMYTGYETPGPFNGVVFVPVNSAALQIITGFLFVMVWASDTIAYVFGKTFGGPKMAPKISPNKTWAGMIGSMFGAAGALVGLRYVLETQYNMQVPGITVVIVSGFAFGVIGQIGDVAISYFKRDCGVKDTGCIIPGHGGVLDRIDALLLIAPIYAFMGLRFLS